LFVCCLGGEGGVFVIVVCCCGFLWWFSALFGGGFFKVLILWRRLFLRFFFEWGSFLCIFLGLSMCRGGLIFSCTHCGVVILVYL